MARNPLPVDALNARARAAKLVKAHDLAAALDAYQSALALTPDDPDLLAEVARLAETLETYEVAATLWGRMAFLAPERLEAVDGHARALRELGRFDEAVAMLREALLIHPQEARLWNALGVALMQQGRGETALTFLDEAVRLDARLAPALYNRAGVHFDLGAMDAAADDYAAARKVAKKPEDIASIDFAAATLDLARGRLEAGWAGYETRFAKAWSNSAQFEAPGRRWSPGMPLAGKRLLLLAEQGVGDELMFLTMLPEVRAALGAEGRLDVAIDPRLAPLIARSYPDAAVTSHATSVRGGRRVRSAPNVADPRTVDLWAPIGSLTRQFRRELADFPATSRPLKPDPARVEHWRRWLGEGPTVGVSWRSGKVGAERRRHYPELGDWTAVLKTPGVRLVNVQYGADPAEVAEVSAIAGREVLTPPGLDLRDDLDDLAALLTALDVLVTVVNATAQVAASCGRPVVMLSAPAVWPLLGTDRYPWHPTAKIARCERVGEWGPAVVRAAELASEILAKT